MIPISDDNPSRMTPLVTWILIGASVLVFFWQIGTGEEAYEASVYTYGFVPVSLFGGAPSPGPYWPWITILTSMFLHGGFAHLGGNMLYLWIFGNNIEDAMGHARFLAFYLLSGAGAALSEGLIYPGSEIPMIGASGAISGVLAAYLLIFPRARITVIVPLGVLPYTMKISALFVIGFWFLIQLLQAGMSDPNDPGVAWWAHVGGFAAGLALTPLFSRYPLFGRLRRGPWG